MDTDCKMTCLYDAHIALNARMSPFAGYMMPIQYSGILDEHNAVRNACGMFDVSHMGEIFISGSDAAKFVNHIFTNDVRDMPSGKIIYGMMLYPDGGTVDDLLVYREYAPDSYLLVVNAANIDKDYAWMLENSRGFDVRIDNRSEEWGEIAVQGPEAEKFVTDTLGFEKAAALGFYEFRDEVRDDRRVIVSRTGYTGEDGFEIYASPSQICGYWKTLLDAGVKPCGLGCRDTLRFEAGMPLYGDELSAEISPVMSGLGMFCKFDKEEFIGKDALLQQKSAGPAKKIVGIEIEDNAVPRAGYPVELEDGAQVGVVTTGYHSPTLDRSLCFALVDSTFSAMGTPLWIRIRRHVFPGHVVGKRFYKTNYKK